MKKIWNGEEKTKFERELLEKGYTLIAGVDEVGRGPLAGPVVCSAVIMPLGLDELIAGVDDSKKLSAKKREELAEKIKEKALIRGLFLLTIKVLLITAKSLIWLTDRSLSGKRSLRRSGDCPKQWATRSRRSLTFLLPKSSLRRRSKAAKCRLPPKHRHRLMYRWLKS